MQVRCPHCFEMVFCQSTDIDIVHDCNSGKDALDNEDVVKIGTATEFGETVIVDSDMVPLQGMENKIWGTEASFEQRKQHDRTDRGRIKSTHRQRKHYEHITLKEV